MLFCDPQVIVQQLMYVGPEILTFWIVPTRRCPRYRETFEFIELIGSICVRQVHEYNDQEQTVWADCICGRPGRLRHGQCFRS